MRFMQQEKGDVVGWIIVLAVIMIIGAFVFPLLGFQTKYTSKQTEANVDYALDNGDPAPPSETHDEKKYLIGREMDGYITSVDLTAGPEKPPYLYHYNDQFQVKAFAVPKKGYSLAYPLKCTWQGYADYAGTSCDNPPVNKFSVGTHTVKVRLCDQNGACGNGSKIITVGYKDPIQLMAEEWTNYKRGAGDSGEWKFDKDNMTIYSTKNVNWTGYYNPADSELQDYKISFSMGVVPADGDDDVLGFTFRMQDMNNMYVLSIDKRDVNGGVNGYHSGLYRIKNGTKTLLVDMQPLKWEKNVYMDVKMEVIGNKIVVFIDGKKVADYSDANPLLKGSYGPFTYSQANGRYKNLNVEVLK